MNIPAQTQIQNLAKKFFTTSPRFFSTSLIWLVSVGHRGAAGAGRGAPGSPPQLWGAQPGAAWVTPGALTCIRDGHLQERRGRGPPR